jgi:DNA-binding PadR family transcriptional regulator
MGRIALWEDIRKPWDNPWQAHVTDRSLTDFEQVLLGLIVDEPSSGYALKAFLTTTPASVYQPSSGALYPALKRLERYGLLRSGLSVGAGRRKRRVYHATAAGIAAHVAWVRQPVQPGGASSPSREWAC